jgi:hypothetical protein
MDDIPAMGGICRHDLRRTDVGCQGAATHHRLGLRRAASQTSQTKEPRESGAQTDYKPLVFQKL